jgi:hypothetical protein
MNSSGLLEPSYLSMCPALNFSSQMTCLSGAARAQKPPLPSGASVLLENVLEVSAALP